MLDRREIIRRSLALKPWAGDPAVREKLSSITAALREDREFPNFLSLGVAVNLLHDAERLVLASTVVI